MRARVLVFLAIFITSAGFDQASKEWARDTLTPHVATPVVAGYWDWQLEQNPGTAFYMLATTGEGSGSTALHVGHGVVAAIALIALGITTTQTHPDQKTHQIA